MLNHFFCVPIYIDAPAVNNDISNEIDSVMAQFNIKNEWQPDNDTASTTFSRSGETNIIDHYNMSNMRNFVFSHVSSFLKQTNQPYIEHSVKIVESWINTFNEDQSIGWHGHGYQPNTISGCYYHKAPLGCGRLKFKSPNPYNISFPHHSDNYPSIVNIEPEQGMIVLFPNWILHGTEPNRVKDMRVSLAFNLEFDYSWYKE